MSRCTGFVFAAASTDPHPRPTISPRDARLLVEKVTRDTIAALPPELRVPRVTGPLGVLTLYTFLEMADVEK